MAKQQSVLDIIIKTIKQGGGDKEAVKGLVALKGTITGALSVFGALAGAAYAVDKVLDATVGTYVTYAQKVRDSKLALGLSADETSRVIALTDDLGISYEDLSATIKKNADNTNFSIDGMAAQSVAYLAITDAADRAKFAQAAYGKQWVQMAKLLEKGPEQIRQMAAAIDQAHLFDDEDLKQAEEYRVAIDKITDAKEGLAMSTGRLLLPAEMKWLSLLTDLADTLSGNGPVLAHYTKVELEHRGETDAVTASYVAWAKEIETTNAQMADSEEIAQALAIDYDKLLGSIKNMQSETDRYKDTQEDANDAIAQANKDFAAGTIDVDEKNKILQDSTGKLQENEEAHRRWAAETVLSFATAKAAADGSISEGEGQILIDAGVALGVFDEKTATVMQNVNKAFDEVDTENAQEVIDALKKQLMELTGESWNINITASASGSGGDLSPDSRAIGGPVSAGDVYRVHQDELFVPNTDGYVLTRRDARAIAGGDTNTNNSRNVVINGPLTIIAQTSVRAALEELG